MDLSSGKVSFNGWTNTLTRSANTPADGWEIIHADISPIGVAQYFDKKALQDGMDANDVYESQRSVNLIVGVYGSTKGRFFDNLQAGLAAFNPVLSYNADTGDRGFQALTFYQPTANTSDWPANTYPNGIPMKLLARPAAPPTYRLDASNQAGPDGKGLSTQVSVGLLCRNPRKYVQDAKSFTLSTSTQTATHRGDYPTFPVVTFSLSATGHSAYTLIVGSAWTMAIDLSSLSSGSYTIDFGTRTFLDANGNSKIGLATITGAWPQVDPADTTTFKHSNATGISTPLFFYNESFA